MPPYCRHAPAQRPDRIRPRLAVALIASTLVHLWLLGVVGPGAAVPRGDTGLSVLEVRLAPVATVPDIVPGATAVPDSPAAANSQRTAAAATATAVMPRAAREPPNFPRMHENPKASRPVPAPVQYYAVHELDEFPRLAGPAPLDAPSSGALPARRMRLELSIDASGTVTRVVGLEPDAGAALALWRLVRFEPARRAGRAVASRIEIEVEY